jgi:hypothetical protein
MDSLSDLVRETLEKNSIGLIVYQPVVKYKSMVNAHIKFFTTGF